MSKLSELINKLCPNGVEYKKLGEIVEINKGEQLNKQMLLESGNYPVINGGVNPSGYWDKYNKEANLITISQGGASAGYVNWQRTRFWAGAHCFVLENPSDFILYRYLYFVVKKNESVLMGSQIGAGIPSLSAKTVSDLSIPLPPLEIQREVVEILDKFAQLTAELTAELQKRKKQYEHYRDMLLNFTGGGINCEFSCEWKQLGEICEMKRGRVISKDYLRENEGIYPVYSSQTLNEGIFGYISSYDFDGEYLTWTTDGANAGAIFYHNGKFSITNVCGLLKPKYDAVAIKYLFYWLQKEARKHVSSGMGNPKLMSNTVASISIPLPPLAEQERIVSILDRFDSLCNSLTEGLPAEIALRKKQYEYYRDKLLDFEKAG